MKATSQSKLKTWEFCPAGFYVQYILGLDFYSPHFDFGKDYHKNVENYHRKLPYDADMIKEYTNLVAQDDFLEVEKKYSVTLHHPTTGKALPLPISLVIDRVVNKHLLSDLKTSKVAWNQSKIDTDIQATVYCYSWWELYGETPDFEFVVVRKNPGPRTAPIERLTTSRDISDFAAFWDWANGVLREAETAIYYPCNCTYGVGHRNLGLSMIR